MTSPSGRRWPGRCRHRGQLRAGTGERHQLSAEGPQDDDGEPREPDGAAVGEVPGHQVPIDRDVQAGQFTGEGFRLGSENKHKAVEQASARLGSAALINSCGDFGAPVAVAGQGGGNHRRHVLQGIQDPAGFLAAAKRRERMYGP